MSFMMGVLAALIVYGNYQVKDLQKQLKAASDKIDALDAAVMTIQSDLTETALVTDEIRRMVSKD